MTSQSPRCLLTLVTTQGAHASHVKKRKNYFATHFARAQLICSFMSWNFHIIQNILSKLRSVVITASTASIDRWLGINLVRVYPGSIYGYTNSSVTATSSLYSV